MVSCSLGFNLLSMYQDVGSKETDLEFSRCGDTPTPTLSMHGGDYSAPMHAVPKRQKLMEAAKPVSSRGPPLHSQSFT